MTLAAELRRQIADTGPMALSRFMGQAVAAYYGGRDPFGGAGDFITAPEISQMFGEVIGLWAAVVWQMLGQPAEIHVAELGPGRGTLMADLLRAAATMPAFDAAIRLHLVETSPALRQRQRQVLGARTAHWHERAEQLPDGPLILIANEFVDALPIDQYVRRADGWHQRLVDDRDGAFVFVEAAPAVALELADAEEGAIFEVNPAGRALAAHLGARFGRGPGVALLIDYGHALSATGDTLQALWRHRSVPPLERPGEVDLTAHVDFAALARAAAPARCSPIVSQGSFLRRLGIELRATRLAAARPDRRDDLESGCLRLINPQGMGTLFKVLAIGSADLSDLPGFSA